MGEAKNREKQTKLHGPLWVSRRANAATVAAQLAVAKHLLYEIIRADDMRDSNTDERSQTIDMARRWFLSPTSKGN